MGRRERRKVEKAVREGVGRREVGEVSQLVWGEFRRPRERHRVRHRRCRI
jgi:hypothetical protein